MPVTVVLVDDHAVVRAGLRELIEAEDDLEVVGEMGTADEARRRIPALRPDVAVLDVRLPDGDGVEICQDVRSHTPEVACLILTSYADDEALVDAVLAGAAGFLLKEVRAADIVGAVRTAAAGESLFDAETTERVLARLRDGGDDEERRLAELSDRERRIFDLIGEGLTNRQIAEEVHLAEKTIKNYVSNILTKMGMQRRTQAAAYAARLDERRRGERRL